MIALLAYAAIVCTAICFVTGIGWVAFSIVRERIAESEYRHIDWDFDIRVGLQTPRVLELAC
jgi:hypothetical protein